MFRQSLHSFLVELDEHNQSLSLPSPFRFERFRRSWGGGWRKQYLGALVIILLALNAPGNLLRFTSVVENNSFPLSPKTIYGAGWLARMLFAPRKRQKNARYHLIVFIYDYYCDWDARGGFHNSTVLLGIS